MIMVRFVFFIALGVGSMLFNDFIARLAFRRGWFFKMLAITVTLIEILAFLIGLSMFAVSFNGYPLLIWPSLYVLAPSICVAYSMLRWAVYGRKQDDAWWAEYTATRQRLRRAIALFEDLGFTFYEVNENMYIVDHPNSNVTILRGMVDVPTLIHLAERVEPLVLIYQLKGEPIEQFLVNFESGIL